MKEFPTYYTVELGLVNDKFSFMYKGQQGVIELTQRGIYIGKIGAMPAVHSYELGNVYFGLRDQCRAWRDEEARI